MHTLDSYHFWAHFVFVMFFSRGAVLPVPMSEQREDSQVSHQNDHTLGLPLERLRGNIIDLLEIEVVSVTFVCLCRNFPLKRRKIFWGKGC